LKSEEICQGIVPFFPIPLFSSVAAIMLIIFDTLYYNCWAMIVKAIKTKKVVPEDDLFEILNNHLPEKISDKFVLVVSSKIVAITEGRIVEKASEELRDELAIEESEVYLPRSENQYGYMITVNNGVLLGSGGIDQSNGNGALILWPKDPQKTANEIREYLIKKYKIKNVGVIISDSKSTPLRWGATGVALAHSGFKALKNYIGTEDIFGRKLRAERANIYDALATAATLEMGEGNEQKPLAIVTEISSIEFQHRNPTKEEIDFLHLTIETDFYAPIINSPKWSKGKKA
jgi:F420-0:gamma-glutamyl ligase